MIVSEVDHQIGMIARAAQDAAVVVFDTAPTGHALRLFSLPKAWSGFLDGNERGASCLGPHPGRRCRRCASKAALDAFGDPARTTVILVTRADKGAIAKSGTTLG